MAWTYHDYESQASDTLRLERLRLHIAEVSQALSQPAVSGVGYSRDPNTGALREYLADLRARRAELESRIAIASGSRVTHLTTRRPI